MARAVRASNGLIANLSEQFEDVLSECLFILSKASTDDILDVRHYQKLTGLFLQK